MTKTTYSGVVNIAWIVSFIFTISSAKIKENNVLGHGSGN
jgi:hypothetical protein